jgi:hypothetical protein
MRLVTVADDRHGRKGGAYEATQRRIRTLLGDWISQRHYTFADFKDCDSLMKNKDAARNGRVYKPWTILHELERMQDGEFLIYNDCSPELWPDTIDLSQYDLSVIEELTCQNDNVLVGFVKWDRRHLGKDDLGIHTHHFFTLDSCLELMHAEKLRHSFLCASGMICIRKTEITTGLVRDWLFWNRIPACSCMRANEHEDSYFDPGKNSKFGNRHDQSVLSVLLNQANWSYCDIVYNDMNPYNFLNYCLPGHEYNFIPSNRSTT